MKKIEPKKYIYLGILILTTVLLTIYLSQVYINRNRETSKFYENSNKITAKELESYLIENIDSIIYINDKYDIDNETFEIKFEKKLTELNLKDKFVYLDKSTLTKKDISKLEKKYKATISFEKSPVILLIIDKNIESVVYVTNNIDVDKFINYEVFE